MEKFALTYNFRLRFQFCAVFFAKTALSRWLSLHAEGLCTNSGKRRSRSRTTAVNLFEAVTFYNPEPKIPNGFMV